MADPEIIEEGAAEQTAEQTKKAKKKGLPLNPLVIGAVAGVLLAVVAAFFLVRALLPRPGDDTPPPAQEQGTVAADPKAKKQLGELYEFEDAIVVNLAGTNAERYLKVALVLEVENSELKNELTRRKPQVLDLLINILSNKNLEDISSTAGRNMLRQEIIDKINALLEGGRIRNIYFTEFVVQ